MAGGMDVARPIALASRCTQSELADGKNVASGINYRAVHHTLAVGEDAHGGAFGCEPAGIIGTVAVGHTDKHHQSGADSAVKRASDAYRSLFYTLYN